MNKNKGRKGGKPAPAPTMHTHHPHFAEVVLVSANGRTATSNARTITTAPSLPTYAQEDVMTNAAVESWEFGYDLGDTSCLAEIQVPTTDGIQFKSSKQKVYENSVRLNWSSWLSFL